MYDIVEVDLAILGFIVDNLDHLFFLYSSLPAFDKDTKEKVDKDIESARKWIKEYL